MAQFLLFLLVRTRVDFARVLEWSWRSCRPMTHHPHHFPEAANRTALGIWICISRRAHTSMCIYYFTWLARILQQRSVDTINYQLYFHFIFLSLISLPDWGSMPQWNQRGSCAPPFKSGEIHIQCKRQFVLSINRQICIAFKMVSKSTHTVLQSTFNIHRNIKVKGTSQNIHPHGLQLHFLFFSISMRILLFWKPDTNRNLKQIKQD